MVLRLEGHFARNQRRHRVGSKQIERSTNAIARIVHIDDTRRTTLVLDRNTNGLNQSRSHRIEHHVRVQVLAVLTHCSRAQRVSRHLHTGARRNTLTTIASSSSLLLVIRSDLVSVDSEDLAVGIVGRTLLIRKSYRLPHKAASTVTIKHVCRMSRRLIGRNVRGNIGSVTPLSVALRTATPGLTKLVIWKPSQRSFCRAASIIKVNRRWMRNNRICIH